METPEMELIEKLSAMIAEEMEGAAKYAHCALKMKQDHTRLAEMFHTMAQQEMEHTHMLQDAATAELKALHDKYKDA